MAISGNGDTIVATDAIAATAEDREVVLWTADRGRQQLPLEVRFGSRVAASPSGLLIIVSGENQLAVVNHQSGHVTRVQDSARASRLATPNESELVVLRGGGGWERRTLPDLALVAHSEKVGFGAHSYAEALSDDGRFFSFTNGDTEIPVWATSDGPAVEPPEVNPLLDNPRPDRTARGPGHYPEALAIDANGNRVAVADTGTITVSDATQGSVIATLSGNSSVNDSGLRFLADGDRLLSASGAAVALWDLRQLNRIATTTVMAVPWGCSACPGPSIAVSPDGRWEALVDGSGRAAVVRSSNSPPRSETVIASGDRGGYSYGPLLWSADSTRLFLSREDGSVEIRATADGMPVVERWQPAKPDTGVTAMARSRDGKQVITVLANGDVAVRDSATGQVQRVTAAQVPLREASFDAFVTVAVSPDSSRVAGVVQEGVQLIDIRSGVQRTARVDHALAVAFTPTHLLVLRVDGTLEVWDAEGAERQGVVSGAARDTAGLVASPTTERAARLRSDGTLTLVDIAERQVIGSLHVPIPTAPRDVAGLGFAPNGSTLLVAVEGLDGGEIGQLHRWQLSERAWLEAACHTVGRDLTADEWRRYVGDQVPAARVCAR